MWARAVASMPFLSALNGWPKYSVTAILVSCLGALLIWVSFGDSDEEKPKQE
jgi:hypothetical protein